MPPEEARAEMDALLADRALLRDRLLAALDFVRAIEGVNAGRIAAIGFCFGGLGVLDLARSGGDVRRRCELSWAPVAVGAEAASGDGGEAARTSRVG